uniref:Integrin beta-like protein 1 n=1 Tax=Esox lucius TaxID=8010 RepID=A0A3P8ZWV9_ESOLU
MRAETLVNSMLVPLLLIQLTAVKESLLQSLGQVCTLSTESSQRRCKTPDGLICSGRGECNCGACVCQVAEPGNYYGPRCECHDWVCATYDGKTCGGHGECYCGKCECDEGRYGEACQYQEDCNLTRKKSKELCRNPQGVVCSNAGSCQCGSCMCHNPDGRGLITGQFCECDDSECLDEDTGEVCGGHGQCYCGNCYCGAGWHGDKCEFQCDISPWESKRRCTSSDGKICSNRGTCVCGECTCHDVDPSGDWGDIHGDTCECDERICHSTYDRYSDDFCSGHGQCNCGRCECKEGWTGKKCEHPLSCSLSLESSLRKCKGTSSIPCFGRGLCQCGQCSCHPLGDTRVHGKNCECDDRQCEDINGEICGGEGAHTCTNTHKHTLSGMTPTIITDKACHCKYVTDLGWSHFGLMSNSIRCKALFWNMIKQYSEDI